MAIKNNDDVAHLLSATGRTGTPYREFDTTTDQMSAPLIDAIFGKDPPSSDRPEIPLAVGATSGNDLLADVFDRSTAIADTRPAERGAWRNEAFQHAAGVGQTPAPAARGPHRTLADIRRIISQPVGQAVPPPSTGGLNGLFDRLAR
jgi:hypothetical protein